MDPESEGPTYCSEQIKIPPELPEIMKQFTKAAIRTQPADLLAWSSAYFEALSKGEEPPVKDRLELPLPPSDKGGMSKGLLKVLHKQLGAQSDLEVGTLEHKWIRLGMTRGVLEELLGLGGFDLGGGGGEGETLTLCKLLVLACSMLNRTLTDTMTMLCEIQSADPDGGAARVQLSLFTELFEFLYRKDGRVTSEQAEQLIAYLTEIGERQEEMVGPADFRHKDCPVLGMVV